MRIGPAFAPSSGAPPLRLAAIARFHGPLVANALLLTLLGPAVNGLLLRSADPPSALGAFWSAYALAFALASWCAVMQQVGAIAPPASTRTALPGAALLLGGTASLGLFALASAPAARGALAALLPRDPQLVAHACSALRTLAALPLLVALRGVAFGMAVRARRTALPFLVTATRLAAIAALAALPWRSPDAELAARVLVAALAIEALVAFALTRTGRRADDARDGHADWGARRAVALALPLVASALGWTLARPLVHAVIARAAGGSLALAGFGVVLPAALIACAPAWAMLDVVLVLPRTPADLRRVALAAAAWASVATLVLALPIALPAARAGLFAGQRLSSPLAAIVTPALPWLLPLPFLVTARAIGQGLLVRVGRARALLVQAPLKLALMAGTAALVLRAAPAANGVVLGCVLLLVGELADTVVFAAVLIAPPRRDTLFGGDLAPVVPHAEAA